MKIAIASSGLGHVSRGIETWARDTAFALAARGGEVTLFCGDAPGPVDAGGPEVVVLPCLKRNDRGARFWGKCMPPFAWRWGLKDAYGWEQFSFWRALEPRLRAGNFNVLHVQDPMIAYWCQRAFARGRIRTPVILAHGTEEPPVFLSQFDFVQELAPWHLEQSASVANGRRWVAIPNFVDTTLFRPAADAAERQACREAFGLGGVSRLIGCAAAVKRSHKRIDYLIQEFATFADSPPGDGVHLLIAGARQADTQALMQLAEKLAPSRIHFALDLPRARMPDFFRALDACVLTSLLEMMPIAVLEALATGVPMIVNEHPVLTWMTGDGGVRLPMDRVGALSGFLSGMDAAWCVRTGAAARARAESEFGRDAVVARYEAYYREVAETAGAA